jgi:hypothetical protein
MRKKNIKECRIRRNTSGKKKYMPVGVQISKISTLLQFNKEVP